MTEKDLGDAILKKVYAEGEKYSYIEDAQKGLSSAVKDLKKFRDILCVKYNVYSITDLDSIIRVCESLVDKTGNMLRDQSIRVAAMRELAIVIPVTEAVPEESRGTITTKAVPVIEKKTSEEKQKEVAPKPSEVKPPEAKPTEVFPKAPAEKEKPSVSPEEKKVSPGLAALQKRREMARQHNDRG